MKKFIIVILMILTFDAYSQDTLYLDTCIELTIKNHPVHKSKILNKKISELTIKNNRSNYYPDLNFEGKTTYQSDAFRLDIDLPDIPGFELNLPDPPLDQYNLSLTVSQLIYDGGAIKNLNFIEQKKLLIEQKNTDIELYKMKEVTENTYFSILILQKSEEQLTLTLSELQKKKKSVKSAVSNGILTQDNYDILQAEIYKLEQNLTEVEENKKAGIRILKELMSIELSGNTKFKLPDNIELKRDTLIISRPENELFSIQNDLLKANEKLLVSGRLPKLGAFAQAGYGNPGLTMINDEWSPYIIVGAKLTWNIWDRNITKRNKDILKIKNDLTDTKKESFEKSINIQCEKELAKIYLIEKMIEKDFEIIKLQESICKKADSKLNNGTITSTDYITLLNDKSRSIIKSEMHKIKLIQAKRNYLRIIGN